MPIQQHLSKKGTAALAPALDVSDLAGAIRFYDARVDDSRLVLDLVRTAVGLGAHAASRTRVTGFLKDERGQVTGAEATDLVTGETLEIRAKRTINAAGVWTEEVQDLATKEGGLKVLASKGIHIVVPREAIDAQTGIFLRTEKSVLFIIPWPEYWIIGTTDTPWDQDVAKPVATAADVDYILEHANSVLNHPISRQDIIGVYAGLRPLLQPKLKPGAKAASTKVSREHTVTRVAPGLTAIAGGKLTTYRVMAEDAVDHALGEALARVTHLLDRYGSETLDLLAAIDAAREQGAEPGDLDQPLEAAPEYLRGEVAWAVTHEGALSLEDVLTRRVRLDLCQRDRGLGAAIEARKKAYAQRVEEIAAAEAEATDAAAVAHLTNPI